MHPPTPALATSPRHIVLVVHRVAREATRLEALLRATGYVVQVTTDGAATLELARRLQPDAIVLDLTLDHRDGIALGWHLRADPATAHLPLIGVAPSRRLSQPASSMTVDALLPPPPTEAALCATVAQWAGRHRWPTPCPDSAA